MYNSHIMVIEYVYMVSITSYHMIIIGLLWQPHVVMALLEHVGLWDVVGSILVPVKVVLMLRLVCAHDIIYLSCDWL